MRTPTLTALAATTAALLALTGCGGGNSSDKPDAGPTPTASALSDADLDAARKAAGLPPQPSAAARRAFLDALDAIDPRIAKPGKDDQTVSRGLNQCGSIKTTKDTDQLISQTLGRFTITTRLPDISTADTGGRVLDAVHQHLCPTSDPCTEVGACRAVRRGGAPLRAAPAPQIGRAHV